MFHLSRDVLLISGFRARVSVLYASSSTTELGHDVRAQDPSRPTAWLAGPVENRAAARNGRQRQIDRGVRSVGSGDALVSETEAKFAPSSSSVSAA